MWVTKLSRLTFFFGLLLPITILPITILPSTAARAPLILFTGLCALIVLLFKKRETLEFTKTELLLMLYIVALITSSAFGVNPRFSFWSEGGRALGTVHWIAWFLWFLVARDEMRSPEMQKQFWWIVTLEALLVSILSLFHPFFFDCDDPNRLCGSYGNPMIYAAYLAPLILILAAGWWWAQRTRMSDWYRIVFVPLTIITVGIALYQTLTRGAILGAAVGVGGVVVYGLVHFFTGPHRKNHKRLLFGALVFLGIIFGVLLNNPSGREQLFHVATLGRGTGTVDTRLLNWRIAWRGAQQHIFLGRGPENYRAVPDEFFDPALLDYSYYETRIDKPHNAQLELLVSSGIVGVVTYVLFVIFLFTAFLQFGAKIIGPFGGACLAAAVVALEISLAVSFETYASMTILGYLMLLAHSVEPVWYRLVVPRFNTAFWVRAPLVFVAGALFVYGSILPLHAAYFTQQALNRDVDQDIVHVIDAVHTTYAWPLGPYDFEVWQWISGSLISRYVDNRALITAMDPSLFAAWRSAVIENAGRTKQYLAQYQNDARWQLFAGKVAYNTAIVLDDPQYLVVAEGAFKRAHELSPQRQEVLDVLVYVYMLQAQYEKAVRSAVAGLQIRDTLEMRQTIDALVLRLQKENRIDLVVELFTGLIQAAPTAERYARLAAADAALHNYTGAKEAVQRAVQLDASFAHDAEVFLKQLPKK